MLSLHSLGSSLEDDEASTLNSMLFLKIDLQRISVLQVLPGHAPLPPPFPPEAMRIVYFEHPHSAAASPHSVARLSATISGHSRKRSAELSCRILRDTAGLSTASLGGAWRVCLQVHSKNTRITGGTLCGCGETGWHVGRGGQGEMAGLKSNNPTPSVWGTSP